MKKTDVYGSADQTSSTANNTEVMELSDPMIFTSDAAFQQLKLSGQVSSARSTPREPGEVWIRRTRTGEKLFDAEILNVDEICWGDEKDLYFALHNHDLVSGFQTVHKWKKEIERLNGGSVPNPLYIHHVVRENHSILRGDSSE